ncbi:chaperonin 10-like protein [Mycena galopus ATCC 62051]|nr:chaperonin 10-like protein [Mycena galopus ATCC 62051]
MMLPTKTRQYRYKEFGSYDNLVFEEVSLHLPKRDEVLVKTHAVSLEFRDLLTATGRYPSSVLPDLVPCSDMAGEVIAVGQEVKQWNAGDQVCANIFLEKLMSAR